VPAALRARRAGCRQISHPCAPARSRRGRARRDRRIVQKAASTSWSTTSRQSLDVEARVTRSAARLPCAAPDSTGAGAARHASPSGLMTSDRTPDNARQLHQPRSGGRRSGSTRTTPVSRHRRDARDRVADAHVLCAATSSRLWRVALLTVTRRRTRAEPGNRRHPPVRPTWNSIASTTVSSSWPELVRDGQRARARRSRVGAAAPAR